MYSNRKVVHCMAERWEKYQLYKKMFQIKIVQNLISCKKLSKSVSLSTLRVKLGASKIGYFWNNYSVQEWEKHVYFIPKTSSSNS